MNWDSYIGCMVEIVYMGKDEKITQRKIKIQRIADGKVIAYCFQARGLRTFHIAHILAVQSANKKKSS